MKIARLAVHRVELPLAHPYRMSGGRRFDLLDSTVVALTTDSGLTGWGETCPFGPFYLPAHGKGARAALAEFAPRVLGANPLHPERVYAAMDAALAGHGYAKAAVDAACWDLLGKVSGLAVCELLGGRFEGAGLIAASVSSGTTEEMLAGVARYRAGGARCFSFKLGGDLAGDVDRVRAIFAAAEPGDEYIVDANGGLTLRDGVRLSRALRDLDATFEQPCRTYEECLALRRLIDHPIMLDECLTDMGVLVRAIADRAAESMDIKIQRVGGLSRARSMRDVCVAAGLPVSIQDTGGGDIARAGIAHLAQSTPERFRHSMWDCTELVNVRTATGSGEVVDGRLAAPDGPGLGVEPDPEVLGEPVAVYR